MPKQGASWTLNSSNGYSRLSGVIDNGEGVRMRLRLEYRLPDEARWGAITELATFRPDLERFGALTDSLRSWLAQPLDAMARDPLVYSIELAAGHGDRLMVEFGHRDDLVAGSDDIGCLVELGHSGFSTQLAFVTDATCVDHLVQALQPVFSPRD